MDFAKNRIEPLAFGILTFALGLIPLYFRFTTSELFEFNKLLITYAAAISSLALWLMHYVLQRPSVRRPIFLWPLLLFLFSQVLATYFSIHPYTSLFGYYSRFHFGLLPLLAYLSLYWVALQTLTSQRLKVLFLFLLATSGVVSCYAILEHFGYSISCVLAPGHGQLNTDCWKEQFQVTKRAFATFGQPNWLAAYCVTLLPLSFIPWLTPRQKPKKLWFHAVTSLFLLLALLYTGSRSGFLAASTGLFLLVTGAKIFKIPLSFRKTSVLALSVVVIAGIVGTPYTPAVSQLWQSDIQTSEPVPMSAQGTDSGDIRKIVWKGAFKVWQRYPIFGSGLETFAYSYYQDRPVEHNLVSEWNFLYNKAHNEFLNYLATTGIVGLTAYCVLLGWVVLFSLNRLRTDPQVADNASVILALIIGIVSLTITNFFGFSTVYVTVLFFIFLAAIEVLLATMPLEANCLSNSSRKLRLVGAGFIALGGLFLILQVYRLYVADTLYAAGKQLPDNLEASRLLEQAVALRPAQALYQDELSYRLAQLSIEYIQAGEATAGAALAESAVAFSTSALRLNPYHLNFYKTRARLFLVLSTISPDLITESLETLEQARQLAPTDPELLYSQGVIYYSQEDLTNGIAVLEQAVALKPNYKQARLRLGQLYKLNRQLDQAREQFTYILEKISPEDTQVQAELDGLTSEADILPSP